jgi:nucleotide-binding universal stress UspA family protein
MKAARDRTIGYLTLDKLTINRKVARRLPPALAFHYHAIPVGKANGSVTVAMAHPEDRTACEVIAEALEAELYVVQSDPVAIDEQLAELWSAETGLTLRMLLYHHDSPNSAEIQAYGCYLGDLLQVQLTDCRSANGADVTFDDLVEQARQNYNLIIFGEPDQSLIGRLVGGSVGCKAADQLPASVLIARSPRWPLRNILLVTRGQGFDNIAVDWIIRFAQPSGATVTVLAVQPPMSGADSRALASGGLSDWLATDTPLGQQLGRIARQLVNWEIEGRLHFRQGLPDWQVKTEISEGDHDLVVLAADPEDWWRRRIVGRLVSPLLGWIDRPVLIAKSAIA